MDGDITPLIATIIGTGVGLASLMIGLVAWMRADMRRMEDRIKEDAISQRKEIKEDMRQMEGRIKEDAADQRKEIKEDMLRMEDRLNENIAEYRKETNENIAAHREETATLHQRMAHLDGLLQGLREAIVSRAAA